MSVDKIIQTKNFITFVDSAKSFCTFLETHQSDNYRAFISDIQKQLIELYTFVSTLPDFDLPDRDIKEMDITDGDIRDLLSFTRDRLRCVVFDGQCSCLGFVKIIVLFKVYWTFIVQG
jgi:hypothetical protein